MNSSVRRVYSLSNFIQISVFYAMPKTLDIMHKYVYMRGESYACNGVEILRIHVTKSQGHNSDNTANMTPLLLERGMLRRGRRPRELRDARKST